MEGVAHRTDCDLRQHQQFAKTKLEYFDQERNERYFPHVIEPSAGADRGTLALLVCVLTFVGAAALLQLQINQMKDEWYDKVEVSVFWQHINQPERSHTMIEFLHPDFE